MLDREQLLDDLLRCYMHAAVDRLLEARDVSAGPENEKARLGALLRDGPLTSTQCEESAHDADDYTRGGSAATQDPTLAR
jgi:hypothetical protein